MVRSGEKSQAEIATLFPVSKATVSRMMSQVRRKEQLKAGL
jgi:transposase